MPLRVRDDTGLINKAALTDNSPFNVNVLCSSNYSNKSSFTQAVIEMVDAPNVVAIGVSPSLRQTVVRFGKDTNVPDGSWDAISAAGNVYFKTGDFTAGINNIIKASTEARSSTQTMVLVPSDNVPKESSDTAAYWAFGIVGGLTLCAATYAVYANWRSKKDKEKIENLETDLKLKISELDNEILDKKIEKAEESDFADRLNKVTTEPIKVSAAVKNLHKKVTKESATKSQPVIINNDTGGSDLLTGVLIGEAISHHSYSDYSNYSNYSNYSDYSNYSNYSDYSGGSSSSWGGGGFDSGGGSSGW